MKKLFFFFAPCFVFFLFLSGKQLPLSYSGNSSANNARLAADGYSTGFTGKYYGTSFQDVDQRVSSLPYDASKTGEKRHKKTRLLSQCELPAQYYITIPARLVEIKTFLLGTFAPTSAYLHDALLRGPPVLS